MRRVINKNAARQGKGRDKKALPAGAGPMNDIDCRCSEVSRLTPRELLKLMMRDLAFWKGPEKG